MTGIYTQKDPANPRWFDWFGRPLARAFINDMILMENILTESNLCYTIVRPPSLTKGMCCTIHKHFNYRVTFMVRIILFPKYCDCNLVLHAEAQCLNYAYQNTPKQIYQVRFKTLLKLFKGQKKLFTTQFQIHAYM